MFVGLKLIALVMDFYVLEYKYSTCKISLYVALALWSILV